MVNSIKKTAISNYFKNFGMKTSLCCLYGFFVILCFGLGFLFWPTLIITIPLVILPFTFSFLVCNGYASEGKLKLAMFFGFFPVYFRYMFHGGFRALHGFLKSLIVFAIVSTITSAILTFVVLFKDPSFMELIDAFVKETDINKAMKLLNMITENPDFIVCSFIETSVSIGLSFYCFFHHILTHSPKMYFSMFSSNPISMKDINLVHRVSFPSFRKSFYKTYYSSMWLNALLYCVGYAGGICLSYFVLKFTGISSCVLGLAGGFILNLFVLPYSFDVLEELFKINRKHYALGFIETSQRIINSNRGSEAINEEQKNKLNEILAKEKEEVLKGFEKEKEPEDKKPEDPKK